MLKIGWSKRDVSTEEPVLISGQFYARISKGVLDPIMLNCLVMEDGKDMVIFLSGDFVGGHNILDPIREKVAARRSDIPTEKILFNITHTHCGPDLTENSFFWEAPHDKVEIYANDAYRDFMSTQAADAIIEAYDGREEGSFAYGYGYAVCAHHRRPVYKDDLSLRSDSQNKEGNPFAVDGHAKMYGPTNDEMFMGYEGGADHYINLLYTFDKDENLTGAIINVPCPSQNSEVEYWLTADYWHDVRTKLKEKYGDIYILSQCAAAGDLSPRTLHYKEAEARRYQLKYGEIENADKLDRPWEMYNRKDIAERICTAFDEVLSWAKKDLIRDADVRHTVKTLELPRRLVSKEQYEFAKQEIEALRKEPFVNTGDVHADFKVNTAHMSKISRFTGIKNRYEEQLQSETGKMEMHVIKIGDVAFASNPFELYIDFQHQMQARSPFTQTFVIQLCDQPKGYPTGYLATEKGVANHGYSATIYCNQISPAGGDILVEETLAELKKLHG